MRRLLLCLFVLAVSIGSWALTTSDGWKYYVSDDKVTITGTTLTKGTDLIIPDMVDGKPVTAIGNGAFKNRKGFTGSLTIPESVTTIGNYAFYNCSGLTALTIPEGVTTIGDYAFRGCSGLTGDLTIPKGVTKIGSYAFWSCSGLTGTLTIPEGVTTIENFAFYKCSGLTGLTIPKGVTTIGNGAFQYCSGLTGTLTIPEGVTTIGQSAFKDCSSLTGALTIPKSVTTIENGAFYKCSGLTGTLTIPEGITTIERYTFQGCSGLTGALTIPQSVTTIGEYAFQGCSSLTGALAIPQSVTTIGEYAFNNCSGLSSATFASTGNTTLGDYLFENCSELRYINASNLPASTFSDINVATKFGKRDYTLLYLPEGSTPSSTTENVVIGSTCRNLKLYESNDIGAKGYGTYGYEYATSIIKTFTATSAIYTGKRLEDDGVYTLYLPYKIDLPAEIEAYTLLSYGSKTAVFTKYIGDTLQAYTPYLLRRVAESGIQTLNSTRMYNVSVTKAPDYLNNSNAGTAIDAKTGTWKFLGTTDPISNADAETNRLYVLEEDNTWRPVKSANPTGHVRSLRAFLQAPEDYSGAPLAFMLNEGDTTTGLEEIEAEVKKENVDIYTVEGRFVGRNYESLPSGLYIIGGKKVYKF